MTALYTGYDGVLLDLDGTVYRGQRGIDGAPEVIGQLRRAGIATLFVTNNASRAPDEVATQLVSLGVAAAASEVVTSAQAAASVLAARLARGSEVLVVGTEALAAEVETSGMIPVRTAESGPAGVVQGHSPQTCWPVLAEACLAIRAGSLWVACNVDPTLPAERGQLLGNGALVAALRTATEAEPVVAGKPARPLIDVAVQRLGARRPLLVGDRLDSDIAAAHDVMDSLLVLSGVTDSTALLAAPVGQRPAFVGADLTALAEEPDALRIAERPGWHVAVEGGEIVLRGDTVSPGSPQDALRAMCHHWWAGPGGVPVVTGADEVAAAALSALGIAGGQDGPRGAPTTGVG